MNKRTLYKFSMILILICFLKASWQVSYRELHVKTEHPKLLKCCRTFSLSDEMYINFMWNISVLNIRTFTIQIVGVTFNIHTVFIHVNRLDLLQLFAQRPDKYVYIQNRFKYRAYQARKLQRWYVNRSERDII